MWGIFKVFVKRRFKIFFYFYKRIQYRIFIAMGLSICVGVLDGFGLAMFLPLLQMVEDSSSVNAEGLGQLGFLVEGMENIGLSLTLLTILTVMSIFFTLKGLMQYVNLLYEINLRTYFVRTIRISLSDALSRMSFKAFALSDAGRIQNTMSGEVSRISLAYQSYFGVFQQVVMMTVYMSFAFFIDMQFALLICIGGGLTNFIYKRLYKSTKVASVHLTVRRNEYQGLILQFVSNFKYLKATGYIKRYNQKLKSTIHQIEENNREIGKLASIVTAMREPILILVVCSVILLQVSLLGGALGAILLSLLFFYRALSAMILLQTHYNKFLEVSGSMDNMTSFENELAESEEAEGKKKISRFRTAIKLNHVGFEYSGNKVLRNINLEIEKNKTVALVGESGSGKTTLINIISGLMPVNKGKISVDDINMQELHLSTYQSRIGYITQEPVIFNDSIFNNISFWAAPTPENLQRFKWAIAQASIEGFIEELPEKELTMLGNNGINLSGGQKQRISIARELYKEVDILILDEATSALDSETEEAIQQGLADLQGKYTIITVAHRLSTIKNADKIYVLNRGEVIDQGSFNELVIKSSRFQKMVELQEV